jgi:hypothetical protein
MTWTTFATAGGTSNHSWCWYDLKTQLKLAGWVVKSSGDGLALYSATTDIITVRGTGAGGMNANAWYRIQAPDGGIEIVMQFIAGSASGSGTAATQRGKYSAAAKFTGGSPSSTQVPSATDEGVFSGGGTDAVPTGTNFTAGTANNNGNDHFFFGIIETTAPYRFVTVLAQDFTPGRPIGGWLHDQVFDPGDNVAIVFDMVIYQGGKQVSQLSTYGDDDLSGSTYSGFGGFAYLGAATTANFKEVKGEPYENVGDTFTSPHESGARDLVPLFWSRDDGVVAPNGFVGTSTTLRWIMQVISGQTNNALSVLNDGNVEHEWLRVNNTVLPWAKNAPGAGDPYAGFPSNDLTAILWFDPFSYEAGLADGTAIVIGAPSGLPEDIAGGFSLG